MTPKRYDFQKQDMQLHDSGANLLYVSSGKYTKEGRGVQHSHAFTEVCYIARGKGKYQIRHTCYSVSAGDLILLNPNIEHVEISTEDDPMEYIVLGISGIKAIPELNPENDFRIVHFDSSTEIIHDCLSMMLNEARRKKERYSEVCQHIFEIILIQLIRKLSAPFQVLDIDITPRGKAAQIKEYIEDHFRESISLASLAQRAQVSKYYILHIFDQFYGTSPIQYVQSLRLNEARILLRTTDYSCKRIASMVGYSSYGYFVQRFTKFEGMTPDKYRELAQAQLLNEELDNSSANAIDGADSNS